MPFSPQLTQSIQDLAPLYMRLRTVTEETKLDAEDTRETLSMLVHIATGMHDAKILPVETYEAVLHVVNLKSLDSEELELELELERVELDPATGLPMLTPGQLFAIAHTLKLAQEVAMRDQNLERVRILQARPPSLPVSLTRTRARRDSSVRLLDTWRSAWLATPRRDSFAPANRFPPSTRPTPHMRTLDKSSFSRLLQCRTGHAFTGEYFRAINKPERGFACTCGVPLQTRDHLLVGCPELEEYRAPLKSPGLIVADLLGTREGLLATAKFIHTSGAFLKPADEDAAPTDE